MRTNISGAIRRTARGVPQSRPIPNRDMVPNKAGGYSFKVEPEARILRFLILGSEGGTYYASEEKLTRENAATVEYMLDADAVRVSEIIEDVARHNRAARKNATLLATALMIAHPDELTRRIGYALVPEVCTIGTDWLMLAQYATSLRGWGRGLRRVFSRLYEQTEIERLAFQITKYASRTIDGSTWTHADLVRLSHANPGDDPARKTLFSWLALGPEKAKLGRRKAFAVIRAAEEAKRSTDALRVASLVKEHGLTWEMVNSDLLSDPKVAVPLLATMPARALLRNLGRFTANGLLVKGGEVSALVVQRIDGMNWEKARVHPHALFTASRTYSNGHGLRGKLSWTPVPEIVKALDAAFVNSLAMRNPMPGKTLIAIDCSGSMTSVCPDGLEVTQHAAAFGACLAHGGDADFVQFHNWAFPMNVPKNPSVRKVMDAITESGGTDCASPILYASGYRAAREGSYYYGRYNKPQKSAEAVRYDQIVILTDGETWAGDTHVTEAQRTYINEVNRDCRFVFVAFTPSGTTLADRDDPGTMEVVGFDATAPRLIEDFVKREF
jgi:60 kDa SS-A/Ro ribonucleoprotein